MKFRYYTINAYLLFAVDFDKSIRFEVFLMFKKLFISLIILSALTSEGTAVFAASHYELLMLVYNESSLLGDHSFVPAEDTGMDGLSEILADNVASECIRLTPNSLAMFKIKQLPKSFFSDACLVFHQISDGSVTGFDIINNDNSFNKFTERIVEYTDSSPPIFIY